MFLPLKVMKPAEANCIDGLAFREHGYIGHVSRRWVLSKLTSTFLCPSVPSGL